MAEPFTVFIEDSTLVDLKDRLRRTRWPVEAEAPAWTYGISLEYMQRAVAYWADGYGWRRSEAALNRFPNYRARVDGLDVHFIMERGSGTHPKPLVLTHCWRGSGVELLGVIEPLAHPERFGGRVEDGFIEVVPRIARVCFSQEL